MSKQPLIPPVDEKVRLKDYDPGFTDGYKHESDIEKDLDKGLGKLGELQDLLYAEANNALLIVLQGIDTGGKDGTIRHVFRGVNPQGVQVTSFKQPTHIELSHDYLWRAHLAVPPKGYIGVFNRSHYEDVLVVRVHDMVPKKVWKRRYDEINNFEKMLVDNNVTILKFFLYISKDEQKERLESRLHDPTKQWKFDLGDLHERQLWDEYIDAYEDMLTNCNTKYAPWHIIPGNHKWYRNYIITDTIVSTLKDMKLAYPKPKGDLSNVVIPD